MTGSSQEFEPSTTASWGGHARDRGAAGKGDGWNGGRENSRVEKWRKSVGVFGDFGEDVMMCGDISVEVNFWGGSLCPSFSSWVLYEDKQKITLQSFQTRAVRCDSWHLLASPKVRASCLHSRWDVTTDVPVTGLFFTACIRIRMCWWSEMIYEGRRPILNKGIFKESSTVFVAWTRLSHTRPQRWGYLSLVWKLVEPWKIMNDLGRHKSLGTLGWPFNLNSLLFGLTWHALHLWCVF